MPKCREAYGNRASIVQSGSEAVKNSSSKRFYGTGRSDKKNVLAKLEDLFNRSKNAPDAIIDRNLYKLVCDIDRLKLAYEKLKSKPGMMTQSVNRETLDGISIDALENISRSLKDGSFAFKPGRRIYIPKASGTGTRPLTIRPPRDKIVQEAIRTILEAVFEPNFSSSSHGFRPTKSCHTALRQVRYQFQSSTWVIEGDISNCFGSIDHRLLMKKIEDKIRDRQFTQLI